MPDTQTQKNLLIWQLTMLQIIRDNNTNASIKFEFSLLDKEEFSDYGLSPISKRNQIIAITSLSKEISVIPIKPPKYLQNGTAYDDKDAPPVGFIISLFSSDDIVSSIEARKKLLLAREKVSITFEETLNTIVISINGVRIEKNIGEWQGSIIKCLAENNGEASSYDILEIRDSEIVYDSKFLPQIKDSVKKLNKQITKHTGINKLIIGKSLVKFNTNLYEITLLTE